MTVMNTDDNVRGYDDESVPQKSWTEVVGKKRKKKTDDLEGRSKVTFNSGLLDKQREKLTLFIKRS